MEILLGILAIDTLLLTGSVFLGQVRKIIIAVRAEKIQVIVHDYAPATKANHGQ